jgi:prepilin-type N-terminal cleavage/methylation domain-containing protein
MANDAHVPERPERGFSIVEMLIVVMIVGVMAAVALPNIGQYIRNYKIKGATQEVAGELQSARSRAVMTNTDQGVSFVVVDQWSYRFIQEDIPSTSPERRSGLKHLPTGVRFVVSGLADPGPTLRFLRLGGFCNPAVTASPCGTAVPVDDRADSDEYVDSSTKGLSYIGTLANGSMEIRLRDDTADLERTVRIAPGGRVLSQP